MSKPADPTCAPPDLPSPGDDVLVALGILAAVGACVGVGILLGRTALAPSPAPGVTVRYAAIETTRAPAGALSGAKPVVRAGVDPRDGAAPPPLPERRPANPLAVAQLLSGDPGLPVSRVPEVLGAPVADLVRDQSSILYDGRALAAEAKQTKAAGAMDKGGEAPSIAKPAAMKRPSSKLLADPPKPDPKGEQPTLQWALAQLAAGGINCDEWTLHAEPWRVNTVRNFFYGPQPAQAGASSPRRPPLPATAEDLRDAINAACGLPPGPRGVVSAPAAPEVPRATSAAWWAQMRAAGITCDQWISADRPPDAQGGLYLGERIDIVLALVAQRRMGPIDPWDMWAVIRAIDGECMRSVDPAASDPAAPVRARLAAVRDCAALDGQDKLQQVAVIQRAFPEFTRNPRTLYRLALARYDACHGPSEPGWNGRGWARIYDPAVAVRSWVQHGTDVLGGDIAGMSWAQWVKQGPYMDSGAPDLFDPVQGATGDCYLIAALASCAWSMPDAITRNGLPVGSDRRRFVFGDGAVEVSERTPCQIMRGFLPIFARGSRLGDQWPGVFEKAYAAWKSGDDTDRPDVTAVDNMPSERARRDIQGVIGALTGAVSRSVMALPALTGGALFWHLTYFRSDDELFDLLASYCTPDGRARVPMVAATYGAGGFVDRTGLAPSHVYSVLGFGFHADGRKFVVLRNPWGSAVGGLPSSGFAVPVVGRWLNRLSLNNGDGGCFALAHGAFSAAFMALYGAE